MLIFWCIETGGEGGGGPARIFCQLYNLSKCLTEVFFNFLVAKMFDSEGTPNSNQKNAFCKLISFVNQKNRNSEELLINFKFLQRNMYVIFFRISAILCSAASIENICNYKRALELVVKWRMGCSFYPPSKSVLSGGPSTTT